MSDKALEVYKNPDGDPRGRWRTAPLTVSLLSGARGAAYKKTGNSSGLYTITAPNGKAHKPSSGRCWIAEDSIKRLIEDNRIWWGKDGNAVPMQKIFLEEKGGTKSISTFWKHEEFGSNKKANQELKDLFDDNDDDTENFPTPKPTQLIKTMVSMMEDDEAIVLDFFAGSATTGHSTIRHNVENHKKCKYILVQLPEAIASGKYSTIAEIGKERMRRAAAKIKEENPDYDGDLGFKVFKLDSSNIEAWDSNVENLEESVLKAANVLKDDRSELDIVYELFLKYGLDLSYPVNTHEVVGKQVYEIGAGSLFICLEDGITHDFVEALIQLYETFDSEAAPRVVFKDSGFKTDAAKKDAESTLNSTLLSQGCLSVL